MSKSILLADDSVTIRKVVELTFMDEDYELDSVGSGEEALERLEGLNPDLVIADVHMSGVSGYEVCRQVKESDTPCPVLLLVGTFEPFDAADVEKAGGDRYLKKPFDSQELLTTVRELLAGAERPGAGEEISGSPADGEEEAVAGEPAEEMPLAAGIGEAAPAGFAAQAVAADQETAEESVEPPGDAQGGFAETSPIEIEEPQAAGETATEPAVETAPTAELSDETVDRIARRVAELLADGAVRDVAWEVVPDLAEVVIKERLRELESQVE